MRVGGLARRREMRKLKGRSLDGEIWGGQVFKRFRPKGTP